MITLAAVGMEFGTQELYRDVSLQLGGRERVGLVGPNGSGKSTILRFIAGELQPTSGQVQVLKGTRIAYLPQTGATVGDNTVLEEALTAFRHLDRVHRRMVECEHKMARPGLEEKELAGLLDRYAKLQHEYEKDGYDCEARAKKVLVELGFAQEDFEKRVREQSGGFQVRICLARMLLQEPDLLLLDEPTNYLDIRSIEWLQDYLKRFPGAFIMIAHDRYLLDGLVERIWAIEGKTVRVFPGTYSDYLVDRDRREEQQQKKYVEQQQFIKRTEQFIAKFKGRRDTAPRAMSRQRMLDKLDRLDPVREEQTIRFRFPESEQVHGRAFELRDVGMRFDSKRVFEHVSLSLKGGEKLGLFGPNGAGKTTLLRMLARRLKPTSGKVWWSAKTDIGYYEQGAEDELDEDLTVLETVARSAVGYTESELKGMLGVFLFHGDELAKKVRVLSGGERSRLAIIQVLLAPSNLLVMDEPTNHLDIRSREVLFDAIERYERTCVFAAHDRYMLDRLADKVVRVEAGEAMLFPGNYSYAKSRARHRPVRSVEVTTSRSEPSKSKSEKKSSGQPRLSRVEGRLARVRQEYEQARERFDLARARELAQEVRDLEEEVGRVKADLAADEPGQVPEEWR